MTNTPEKRDVRGNTIKPHSVEAESVSTERLGIEDSDADGITRFRGRYESVSDFESVDDVTQGDVALIGQADGPTHLRVITED